MSAYVYLLLHKSEPRFEVVAVDSLAFSSFNKELHQYDDTRSKVLCLADYAMAKNTEQATHRLFQRYRILPGDDAKRQYPTLAEEDAEWFSAECWGRLHTFIEDNEDLLDCKWLSPTGTQALFAPAATRVAGLHDTFQGTTRELAMQNDIQDTVKRAGLALEALARACRFVAVVQTAEGYQMVGEAPAQRSSFLQQGFELLFPLVSDSPAAASTSDGHYFAVPMRGAPGYPPEDAADYGSWRERLVWAEKPRLPGFDMPLRTCEARQATQILRGIFGRTSCPNDTPTLAG